MKRSRFLLIILTLSLLPLMGGCKRNPFEPYEKVFGTATINGQPYKETATWGWNQQQWPNSMSLYEQHKLIYFYTRLIHEQEGNGMYYFQFYVAVNDSEFEINRPYRIDFYNLDMDAVGGEYISRLKLVPYVSGNREEVLTEGADGMAFAIKDYLADSVEEPIPLKGELVIESIDSQFGICKGSYSLTSAGSGSEKLEIDGKFETKAYISNLYFE